MEFTKQRWPYIFSSTTIWYTIFAPGPMVYHGVKPSVMDMVCCIASLQDACRCDAVQCQHLPRQRFLSCGFNVKTLPHEHSNSCFAQQGRTARLHCENVVLAEINILIVGLTAVKAALDPAGCAKERSLQSLVLCAA